MVLPFHFGTGKNNRLKKLRNEKDITVHIGADCIYIDNKYFYDVNFTPAQQEIVKPFLNGGSEAVGTLVKDIEDLFGNPIGQIGDQLKIKKIDIFTIKDDFSIGVISKYPKL